jgi:hypothetical protein
VWYFVACSGTAGAAADVDGEGTAATATSVYEGTAGTIADIDGEGTAGEFADVDCCGTDGRPDDCA